tara:strand:+ start:6753 stop:7334 length:582 start_codon:yes stop_codon:yes gene_type:complete
MARASDVVFTYAFLKRLVTPFNEMEAHRLGLIDANGKKIRNAKTEAEKNAYGYFDRMVVNLKRLLAKIPGGQSRIANYAAALLLLRENDLEQYSDNDLKALLKHEINELKESSHKPWIDLREEVPTNATGAAVVGTGSDKVHWAPAHPTNKRKRNKVDGLAFLRRRRYEEKKAQQSTADKLIKKAKQQAASRG